MILLTQRQKYILNKGLEKGHLSLGDFNDVYAMPQSRKEAMKRFIDSGLMEQDIKHPGKFILNEKKIKEVLNES